MIHQFYINHPVIITIFAAIGAACMASTITLIAMAKVASYSDCGPEMDSGSTDLRKQANRARPQMEKKLEQHFNNKK